MSESNGNPATTAPPSDISAELLARLLDRVEHIDRVVSRLEHAAEQAPPLVAAAVDTLDDACRKAAEEGIDLDHRLGRLAKLADRLTDDATLGAVEALLDRVGEVRKLLEMLDQAPKFLAMLADVGDEWAAKMEAQGIDVEKGVRQGLHAALWLGNRISETELERFGIFLRSDILEPHALSVVGRTGKALATTHENACQISRPERIGLFGLFRALRDPDVQRSLSFLVQTARCFGNHLPEVEQSLIAPGPSRTTGDHEHE